MNRLSCFSVEPWTSRIASLSSIEGNCSSLCCLSRKSVVHRRCSCDSKVSWIKLTLTLPLAVAEAGLIYISQSVTFIWFRALYYAESAPHYLYQTLSESEHYLSQSQRAIFIRAKAPSYMNECVIWLSYIMTSHLTLSVDAGARLSCKQRHDNLTRLSSDGMSVLE